MVARRKMGGMNIFSFPLGATATQPASQGDDTANNEFEAYRCHATGSFVESGFDSLTCNATASFQDSVV